MLISVVTLYRFVRIEKPYLVKARLQDLLIGEDIKGTLIIAPEGVNGTLSGGRDVLGKVIAFLETELGTSVENAKWSTADEHPFGKLKFPLKPEVVTMGDVKPDPSIHVGTYVQPNDWNALISDPNVLVIDTRNDYETALGSFEGALDPNTKTFREFEGWASANLGDKSQPIAMFCTGGIRCEKATSFLKENGYESVFHLEGGILKYLEEVPEADSLWNGECFVFDDRVSLTHGLAVGDAAMCFSCGRPVAEGRDLTKITQCPYCNAPFQLPKVPD